MPVNYKELNLNFKSDRILSKLLAMYNLQL